MKALTAKDLTIIRGIAAQRFTQLPADTQLGKVLLDESDRAVLAWYYAVANVLNKNGALTPEASSGFAVVEDDLT